MKTPLIWQFLLENKQSNRDLNQSPKYRQISCCALFQAQKLSFVSFKVIFQEQNQFEKPKMDCNGMVTILRKLWPIY